MVPSMATIGKYQIIKIDKIPSGDNIQIEPDHIRLIEELSRKGVMHIVLVFAETHSRAHSTQIAFLLQYVKKIIAYKGKVAAIIPNKNLHALLIEIGVSKLFGIFKTEEEMRAKITENR